MYIFRRVLIDSIIFQLHICTSWRELITNVAFVNDLPEEGFQGPNHVGGATQNYEQLIIVHVQLAGLDTV